MKTLLGKKVIITGGSRGIGKAIVKKIIDEGASVLICSRNKLELLKTCREIDPTGKKVFGIQADVSSIKDCKKLVNYAKKLLKRIDILINNAGIYGPVGLFETNSFKKWQETIAINFLGTVLCSKLVIPIMKKQNNGKIINLSGGSVGSEKPYTRFSAYFTSKYAVVGFTEVLAAELTKWKIQVNCISPGLINTFLTDYLLKQGPKKAGRDIYKKTLIQKRTGGDSLKPVLELIVFLASSESNHISGKFLSAKWDKIEKLRKISPMKKNLFVLRRLSSES